MVGGSVKHSISHPHLLAFMATLLYNREHKANTSHFLLNEYQICPHFQLSASPFWSSTKPGDPQKLANMSLGQGMILHGLELRLLSASRPGECFATPTIPAAPTLSFLASLRISQFMDLFFLLGRSIPYMPPYRICTPLEKSLQSYKLKAGACQQSHLCIPTCHSPQSKAHPPVTFRCLRHKK